LVAQELTHPEGCGERGDACAPVVGEIASATIAARTNRIR
jgi:hypothetical protein